MHRTELALAGLVLATLLIPSASLAQRSTPVTVIGQLRVVASATPLTGIEPHDVSFDTQVLGGSGTVAVEWRFGDGATDTGLNPTHTYGAGVYQATVIAIDDEGATAVDTVEVQVAADLVPQVRIAGDLSGGIEPLSGDLDALVTSGNPPFGYSWSIDGGPPVATTSGLSWALPVTGSTLLYELSVVVTDTDGDVASDVVQILSLADTAPALSVSAAPQVGSAPLSVGFSVGILDGNPPLQVLWEFADGTSSVLASPSHVFATPGTYDVIVRVTDANGDSATDTVAISVTP